jgi:cell division septum initiation protein DivIVA
MTRPATRPGRTAPKELAEPDQQLVPMDPDSAAETKEFSRLEMDAGTTAVLGADTEFRIGMRGYDRHEVDTYRNRIESEISTLRAAHERAVHAHAQAAERLRAAKTEINRLRNESTNSPSALSDRLRDILDLAAQDADQTRADAQNEADQIRADAQNEADQIRARATNDADQVVKQARAKAEGIVNEARSEQEKRQAEIQQAQAAARRQIDAARAEADEARERADVEAAARRREADRRSQEQREHAEAETSKRLADMTKRLADLSRSRDDALATLGRLHEALAKIFETPAELDRAAH